MENGRVVEFSLFLALVGQQTLVVQQGERLRSAALARRLLGRPPVPDGGHTLRLRKKVLLIPIAIFVLNLFAQNW